MASGAQMGVAEFLPAQGVRWNPALEALPLSGIRRMFNLAATMEDVIHLSIGQPDFPTPVHIINAYIEALRAGKTGYTLDAGLPELLAALADYYTRRYGRMLSPDHLLETTGASEGIFLAITSVARPGTEVVIIEPSFILFEPLAHFAGASVRRVVTTAAQGYQVDPQAVIDAMGPKTTAVILNSPGNPTGVVYPRETLEVISAPRLRSAASPSSATKFTITCSSMILIMTALSSCALTYRTCSWSAASRRPTACRVCASAGSFRARRTFKPFGVITCLLRRSATRRRSGRASRRCAVIVRAWTRWWRSIPAGAILS